MFSPGTAFVDNGQLPTTQTAIYTAPVSTVAEINLLAIQITGATAPQTVTVYLHPSGGTARPIWNGVLAAVGSNTYPIDFPIRLNDGDAIEAKTTTGSDVDYTISGQEIP